ncbi:hypothetical protein C5167_046166 [Papaver somniferum]|uniref:Uncharacterized protein n=1 Tax=Papaver somniferum TaxID=3469 RepID=A0A4Y7LGN5_PAPSO|nr:hypothetical protein C5167_046166 [Papaver somniferum]
MILLEVQVGVGMMYDIDMDVVAVMDNGSNKIYVSKLWDVEFGSLLRSLNGHRPLLELPVQLETLDAHPFMPE